jgi:hypothetical protein
MTVIKLQGALQKMRSRLDQPVQYELALADQFIALNPLLGKAIHLTHTGRIFCIHCQRRIGNSFNQGYCYPCFISLAQCDLCIVKPENCHYAAGTCREPDWAQSHCFQPHIVYLANSSGVKVGITRQSQVPTRWIDQGAIQALPVFRTASRHLSGLLEITLAKHVSDKTHWQKMLKMQAEMIDLKAHQDELMRLCAAELAELVQRHGQEAIQPLNDTKPVTVQYPIDHYPSKIHSFNFDKNPSVSGILHGIKGQYLIFDTGVINLRKFAGYEIELCIETDQETAALRQET